MSDVLDYSYRVKAWKLILMTAICAAIAIGMGYAAAGNEAGIRFYGLVTLPPAGATALFWGVAAICAAAAVAIAAAIASGVTNKTYHIRLTPTELTVPAGLFRRKTRVVPLSEIQGIGITSVQGQHFLEIRTPGGKVGVTQQDMGKAAFDELGTALAERVAALRGD